MKDSLQLQKVIDLFGKSNQMHVCIHDISGFTQPELLTLRLEQYIHSSPFCETAKKTTKGMKRCFACKTKAVNKAIASRTAFHGICPLGLHEAVVPIVVNEKTVGIIFVGNVVADESMMGRRMKRAEALTGVSEKELTTKLATVNTNTDPELCMDFGLFLNEYIKLLMAESDYTEKGIHWAVQGAKRYMDSYYDKKITMTDMAEFYHLNPNYLGKIFKKEMGETVSEYLNTLRVKKACKLLKASNQSIMDISMSVGFDNVTYFNRVFREIEGVAPTQYRADIKKLTKTPLE